MDYCIYDSNGQIIRTIQCPESQAQHQAQVNETLFTGLVNQRTQYFLNNELTGRPIMDVEIDKVTVSANGVDYITLSSVLDNAKIFVDRNLVGISKNGIVELTFDTPNNYLIKLVKFPYINKEFIINAN